MASLRLEIDAGSAALRSSSGELLLSVPWADVQAYPGLSDVAPEGALGVSAVSREVFFAILDLALDRARVSRVGPDGVRTLRRVALYNPYTSDIAALSVPATQVFTVSGPLPLPEEGVLAVLGEDVFHVGKSMTLALCEPSPERVSRSLADHMAG